MEKNLKDFKRKAICDNVHVKFDAKWGGNVLLYHRLNSNIMWNYSVPNDGLVSHA